MHWLFYVFKQTTTAIVIIVVETKMFLSEMCLCVCLTWAIWNPPEEEKTSLRIKSEGGDIEKREKSQLLELEITGRNTNW